MSEADFNPYRAPEAAPVGPTPRPAGTTTVAPEMGATYRPNRWRARIAVGVLAFGALVGVAGAAILVGQIDLIHRMQQNQPISDAEDQANNLRIMAAGGLDILGMLVIGLTFLMWMYRARCNLPALGGLDPLYGAGWAIGGWFVPFLNLVRPYQVLDEVWRGSHPDLPITYRNDRAGLPPLRVMVAWWLLLILTNIARNGVGVMERAVEKNPTLDAYLNLSWAGIAESLIGSLVCILAIVVVRRITARQEEKHRRLLEGFPPAPAGDVWLPDANA